MKLIDEGKAKIDGFEIPVQYIKIENPENYIKHVHYHEYIELLYGTDCDATVWINGEMLQLKSGDMIVINSKNSHTVASNKKTSSYAVIKFMPQILYAAEQSAFEFKYIIPFITDNAQFRKLFLKNELENTDVPQLMQNIEREWNDKDFGYEIAIRNYTAQIALRLIRKWHTENCFSDFSETDESLRCIQKAIDYAGNNFSTVTSKEAAELCNLSYSYFSRLFKRVMKKSFTEFVNSIRMNESKRLLVSTSKSITEIALECGFSTTSYYIEQFKNEMGITPHKFRKMGVGR